MIEKREKVIAYPSSIYMDGTFKKHANNTTNNNEDHHINHYY